MSDKSVITFFIQETEPRGGTQVWFRDFVQNISESFDVVIITCGLDPYLKKYAKKCFVIPAPEGSTVLRQLFFLIGSMFIPIEKKSIVHVIGSTCLRRSDSNTVHFSHTLILKDRFKLFLRKRSLRAANSFLHSLINVPLERFCYSRLICKNVTTVSIEMQNYLSKKLQRNISFIRNGIAPLDPGSDLSGRNSYRIFFVGGDWTRKGVEDAISVTRLLRQEGLDVELNIFGEADRDLDLLLGVEEKLYIRYFGVVAQPEIPYGNARVLILPSSFETAGLVFVEAAQYGVPSVAYPVFGTQEPAKQGALILSKPSVRDLATVLKNLLTNEREYEEVSRKALAWSQYFLWDTVMPQWNTHYRRVLEEKNPH
jgi:glycosyltransferase involved in cell wall biosynthesis